ncbi:hypothetical protein ACFV98_38395 [Streptomyces violascens]
MGALGLGLADVRGVWTFAAAGTVLAGTLAAWCCLRSLRSPARMADEPVATPEAAPLTP